MNKRNWDEEDYKVSRREINKGKKTRKCPNCGQHIKNTCRDCGITIDKRGGWRDLGKYDG